MCQMAKEEYRPILVTGATGKQGGAVYRNLRQRGYPVRALTRNPQQPKARAISGDGAEVITGDLEDPDSLRAAMSGVYGVYSVQDSTGGAEKEIRQGVHLAKAAKCAGVSHFVYSSVGSADRKTGIPHFDSKFQIEEHLRGSGLPYTILRPVFFMENWLGARPHIEQGTLALPLAPETRLQMIAVDDIGAFAAMAFDNPRKWQGQAIDLAGDELSMNEIAEALGRSCGREVRYVTMPWEEFEQRAGREMTIMYRWFQDTGYHVDIASLRTQYPELKTFEHWLRENWQAARSAVAQ